MGDRAERAPAVICAPDKFRGALDAVAATEALADGAAAAGCSALSHPLADGGEGTLDVLVAAAPGARLETVVVPGPLNAPVDGRFAVFADGTAVVELAGAAGLSLLGDRERDPLRASTAGVGSLVQAAHGAGAREIVVALGGSATIDGGLGAMRALGARILDDRGRELAGTGADLGSVARIDVQGVPAGLRGRVRLAADVTSPLCGPDGAAPLFGAQKGAGEAEVAALDSGLCHLATVLGISPGAPLGAAGGFGATFSALLGAEIVSGIDLVLERTGFEDRLTAAELCLTGEGAVDRQSAKGKTVGGVAARARRHGVPVVVLAGAVEDEARELYAEAGVAAILPIGRGARPLAGALAATAADLRWSAEAICRAFRAFP